MLFGLKKLTDKHCIQIYRKYFSIAKQFIMYRILHIKSHKENLLSLWKDILLFSICGTTMRTLLLQSVLITITLPAMAQQVADTLFNPPIKNPAYGKNMGSIVLIDEAHNNFHTMRGRYRPFSNVLEKDGYRVKASTEQVSAERLDSAKIFVIANALHSSNARRWTLPTPSAFSDEEIEIIVYWVKEGGSLFLIADHMPFPGAVEKLAAFFNVEFINGFAMKSRGKDIFTSSHGLISSTLTQGRSAEESITSLQSFTGQAFRIPQDAKPIIVLSEDYTVKIPTTAWQFDKDTPAVSGKDLVQGAYMKYGKGRIVFFGEAAMFTAQRQGKNEMGMNQKSASQNLQFLLNVIHWLDGIIQ